MLTTHERLRLEAKLVVPYDVSWRDYTQTYEPKLVWVGADSDTIGDSEYTDYPAIIAEFNSRGGIVEAEESINGLVEYLFDGDNEEMREIRESPQSDELSLTIVTDTSFDESATPAGEMGVPPQVRSEDITRGVWNWVTFEANHQLNQIGDNGERPMTVEPLSSPTPSRVEDTFRTDFTVELQHTVTIERLLEYAEEMDVELTVQ